MNTITIFKDFSTPDQPYYLSFEDVLFRLRDGKVKALIEQIRTATDPKEADRLKKLLPCICFSGRFLRRDDNSMTHHSGYAVLDFDNKPNKYYPLPVGQVEILQQCHAGIDLIQQEGKPGYYALHITDPATFRDSMSQYPFVALAFISPSGTGLKVVIRIPASKDNHRGYYAGAIRFFGVIDPTSINESRICFESYDPDCYVGEEFAEFTDYVIPQEKPAPVSGERSSRTDYSKLNVCAAMIRNAADGGKHETLLKAAKLAGGYIASGLVDESAAVRMLEAEIEAKPGVENIQAAKRTIRDGIEYGKRQPIYEQIPEEQPLPKTESRNGIRYVADVWDKMDDGFHNGKARGETTHFADLDEHFTWKAGDFTVISGRPGSGKSEWALQLMLIKSVKVDWKWAVFSPESYPAEEFYDSLIHALVGKSTDPSWDNQMRLDEYEEAANFIQEHFFYVYPDTAHTIEEIEANFLHLHRSVGINGVLIDPFNQLEQDFSLRDDQYLQRFITNRKRFAIDNGLNYLTIVHPKAMSKNKDGEYDAVDAYDLANGAMWINKTDNFISVNRPNQCQHPKDTSVEIHVKKIKKQKLVGVPGSVFWNFNRKTNRYYADAKSPF